MDLEQTSALLQETIRTALFMASPILLAAMAVGLFISVFQAATQINEQSLTFVPKILTVLVLFGALFPWMMGHLVEFGTRIVTAAAFPGGP